MCSMGLWKTHFVIGTKVLGLSNKPNRFSQHDHPTTLHTLLRHLNRGETVMSPNSTMGHRCRFRMRRVETESAHGGLPLLSDRKSTRLNSSHLGISYAV